jgi:DNA-binding beta-propeller fold protein YncE
MAACLIALPCAAIAGPGDLTYQGCIAEAGAGGCADPAIDSLAGVRALVVSIDGKNVYAASGTDDTVTTLDRAADGSLSFSSCIGDAGASGCTDPADDTLDTPLSVAISPDDADVYAASLSDAAVVHFDRDGSTGDLTLADCINNTGANGCAAASIASMSSERDVIVSPDGSSVYSVANQSVNHFIRNPTTGALTFADCISTTGGGGIAACAHPPVDSFLGPTQLAISPDGTSVYVTSESDHAARMTTFARNTTTGVLTWASCNAHTFAGCDTSGLLVLNGVSGVAVTPDGAQVYVAAALDSDAVSRYSRNPATGQLSFLGCISEAGSHGCVDPATDSLDDVSELAISGDGADVYTSAATDRAVTHLNRAADGTLSFGNCIADFGGSGCVDPPIDSLNPGGSVALSADGMSAYTAAGFSNAITSFTREPHPATTPDTTPPQTTIDKGPKKKSRKKKAKFSFSSSEPGSTFECKFDKKAFASCTPPTKLKKLKPKKHKFQVRATDAAGNVDQSPAVKKFKVLRK